MEQKNNFGLLLGLSIAEIICCCLPAGVVGLIMAIQANNAFRSGDYTTYDSKAKVARIALIIGAIVGIVINVLTLISNFAMIASSMGSY